MSIQKLLSHSVYRQLDPGLWDLTQNPRVILQTVSRGKLENSLADFVFRKSVNDLLQAKRHAEESHAWFQQTHAESLLSCIACFSMEFMPINPAWDDAEAEMLYQTLEEEVVPKFYARDQQGIPEAWVARIRESMARLTPQFSANRPGAIRRD